MKLMKRVLCIILFSILNPHRVALFLLALVLSMLQFSFMGISSTFGDLSNLLSKGLIKSPRFFRSLTEKGVEK